MFAGLRIVDFRGGPFDGHEMVSLSPPIKPRLTIPVTPDALHGSRRQVPLRTAQPTSLAIYELRPVDGGWSYIFVGTEPSCLVGTQRHEQTSHR